MKRCYSLIASAVVASTAAAISSSTTWSYTFSPKNKFVNSRTASSEKEKFAPNFDGLRFIETLITAHRQYVGLARFKNFQHMLNWTQWSLLAWPIQYVLKIGDGDVMKVDGFGFIQK